MQELVEIGRHFSFCAGHRLVLHAGHCKYVHGHNYEGVLRVKRDPGAFGVTGMVCDFSMLKLVIADVLKVFDHSFIMSALANDKEQTWVGPGAPFAKATCMPTSLPEPTVENLATVLLRRFQEAMTARMVLPEIQRRDLPPDTYPADAPWVCSVLLHETRDCFAVAVQPNMPRTIGHGE